jgi:hypothetical protein
LDKIQFRINTAIDLFDTKAPPPEYGDSPGGGISIKLDLMVQLMIWAY